MKVMERSGTSGRMAAALPKKEEEKGAIIKEIISKIRRGAKKKTDRKRFYGCE